MNRVFRIGLIVSYAVAPVLLQAVHLAGEMGRPRCVVCESERTTGCDSVCCAGGCGDRTHHHHDPAHHHDQCAICKASVAQPALRVQPEPVVIVLAHHPIDGVLPTARGRDSGSAHASRAPPARG